MGTTAPGLPSATWLSGATDAVPVVRVIDARVLREPHIAYPICEGHHPYICADIEIDIELAGIPLPPIVITTCSSNVLLGRPIAQSTWPTLEWIYWGEESAFFDSLRTRSGDYVIALEDLREAVLDAAQWQPLVRAACRQVGRMIEQVVERRRPKDLRRAPARVHAAVHDEITGSEGPNEYLSLPTGVKGDAGRE